MQSKIRLQTFVISGCTEVQKYNQLKN